MFRKIAIFTVLAFLLFGSAAYAHPGRTDANGGHNCSDSSKAKGLCTGYHYHNGGSTSSGGAAAPTKSDKDCSDFASYEEVVAYWNAKGYSATNDPENLDGWGNGKVDDGIPCEAPSGYDKSKINNSPEQRQQKLDDNDRAKGDQAGYPVGLQDGYNEAGNQSSTSVGSQAYQEGYAAGYNRGYEEGKSKIQADQSAANNEGYALGQQQDNLTVPGRYEANVILKKAFEDGFKKAVAERVAAKKQEFYQLGFADGQKDVHTPPADVEPMYVDAYEDGYNKGQDELKEKYFQEGYEAAFTMLEYHSPDFANDKFIDWYKEGFQSNKEIEEIKSAAMTLGKSGEPLEVPDEYEKGEVVFKHYYDIAYKKYEEKQSNTRKATMGGMGAIVLGWLARRFYVAKKMVG